MERIECLSRKLGKLRKIDRRQVAFGASGHRYKVRRWSLADIEELEQKVGFNLPEELRQWLLTVGSGPGPNYELVPHLSEPWGRELIEVKFGGEFDQLIDVRLNDLQAMIDKTLSETPDEKGFQTIPKITTRAEDAGAGLLSLGDAGCCTDYVMPLSGELRGKIFYRTEETIDEDGTEHGSVLWPQGFCRAYPNYLFMDAKYTYQQDASRIFGFLDWMEYWLDTSNYLVENYEEYERQLNDWREKHLGWRVPAGGPVKRFLGMFSGK